MGAHQSRAGSAAGEEAGGGGMSEEKKECEICGKEVDWTYACPECSRETCEECGPGGIGTPCWECEDELLAEEDDSGYGEI